LSGVGVFVRRQVVFGNQFRGDGRFGHGNQKASSKFFAFIKRSNEV
jgi:hypothetical protein